MTGRRPRGTLIIDTRGNRLIAHCDPIVVVLSLGSAAGADPLASIPCDVTALNNAIVAANNNTGPHTIRLAARCVYNVHTPASTGGLGDNALPKITGTVTLADGTSKLRLAQATWQGHPHQRELRCVGGAPTGHRHTAVTSAPTRSTQL
jgi:hypothetical protein